MSGSEQGSRDIRRAPSRRWLGLTTAVVGGALLLMAALLPNWAHLRHGPGYRTDAATGVDGAHRAYDAMVVDSGLIYSRVCYRTGRRERCETIRRLRTLYGGYQGWVWLGRFVFAASCLAALCLLGAAALSFGKRPRAQRWLAITSAVAAPLSTLLGLLWIGPVPGIIKLRPFETGPCPFVLAFGMVLALVGAISLLRSPRSR